MKSPNNSTRMRTAGRVVLPLIALLVLASAFSSSARADGRFVYETCDPALAGGNPPPAEFEANYLLERSPDPNFQFTQTCALPSGWIGIAQTGAEGDGLAFLWTTIPNTPGGWVESLSVTASAGNYEYEENFGGISVIYPTAEKEWPLPGSGEIPRYFLVRDEPPTGSEPGWYRFPTTLSCVVKCETGAHIGMHFLAATEVDPTPPVVTAVEVPLVEGDVLRGQQGLKAQATDIGGGVRSLELRVDGMSMPGTVIAPCSAVEV